MPHTSDSDEITITWISSEYTPKHSENILTSQVIFVVFGSRKAFTGAEFFEVRKCLPIEDDAPLALAIVDSLGVVTIFSLTSGIKEHIGLRSWRPGRPLPEVNAVVDPQPGPSRSIKRGRKQVLTPKDELELRNIIVIDD